MRRCARFASYGCSVSLAFAVHAQAQHPAVVWYRASEQCPTGEGFLARLAGKSQLVRLAEPADHFDFLVTLVAGKSETIGRLERQTQSGTVAIRELRDTSCDRIADALALGLSLALEPGSGSEAAAAPVAETSAPETPAVPAKPESEPVLAERHTDRAPTVPGNPQRDHHWSLGLAASALEGAMPRPLWRGSAFVDFAPQADGYALRLGVIGAFGSVATQVGPVRHWLAAGRAEWCPWRFGSTKVGLRPCAAFELGGAGASDSRATGLKASDVWAAPGAALRLAYEVAPPISLETQAGALVPLIRETVYAGTEPLYSAEIIAFQASVGVSAKLW